MTLRKLLPALLLCALLTACTAPASGRGPELGGLTRVSLNESLLPGLPRQFFLSRGHVPPLYLPD